MSKPVYKVWEGSDMMAKYLDLEVAAETARRAWRYSRSLGGSSSIYVELADEDKRAGDHVPVSVARHAWVVAKEPVTFRLSELYLVAGVNGFLWSENGEYALRFERERDASRMAGAMKSLPGQRRSAKYAFAKQVLVDYITEE